MAENNVEAQEALVARSKELDQASIRVNRETRPQTVFKIVLDLSKERDQYAPQVINFPFKSLSVQKASDPRSFVNIKTITADEQQDSFEIKLNDSFKVSEAIPKAFLSWPAQTGSMTILVFTDAEFTSGTINSLNSGGVSISDGATVSGADTFTIAAATPTVLIAQNLFRKVATIQNKTGGDLFLGNATVSNTGATEGIILPAGGLLKWQNTAELYGYSVAGGKITRLEEL